MLPADVFLQALDLVAQELDHPAAGIADHVIVVEAIVDMLEEGLARAKPVHLHETGRSQMLERAVERGPAHPLPFAALANELEEALRIEVPLTTQDHVEHRLPLPGEAEIVLSQVELKPG
jgi:hypothetical protein